MVALQEDIKSKAFRPTPLVNSKYKMTPVQNDIIDFILSEVNEEKKQNRDKDNTFYQISVAKYKNHYKAKDDSSVYRYLKDGVDSFKRKEGFYLLSRNENPLFIKWLSSIEYIKKQGIIEVEISKKFKDFLWESSQTLFYEIEYSINLKNEYSKRLYYYLKDKRKLKQYTVAVETLNYIFEIPETYANSFSKMEKNVLIKAMKEINDSTDISFTYKKIKERKKSGQWGIGKITFYIQDNNIDDGYVAISDTKEYEKLVKILSCTEKQAKEMYDIAINKGMKFDELMDIVNFAINTKFIADKTQFVMTTLSQTESKQDNVEDNKQDNIIITIMNKLSCSEKEAININTLRENYNRTEEELIDIIDYAMPREGIKNKVGYTVTILKHGFVNLKQESISPVKSKNQFNNFTQRQYTDEQWKEIERKKLGI